MSTPYYNRTIRKLVVGFGNLFNDITLVRYNPDLTESERLMVPIAYASKESYVMRLEEDSDLDKKDQMTLPRLSFEMTGLSYDSFRKQNTNIKNFASSTGGAKSQYNPVPYNFDFNLYLYVRNIEDGTQLLEHIIPFFTPDYTIKLNMVPEMGIIKEIPIVLNSCVSDITYEGNREKDPRMIIWTLNFTVKGHIFGKSTSVGLVTHSITSINSNISDGDIVEFSMNAASGKGTYQLGESVYQGFTSQMATATAKVVLWKNNMLHLTNINGNFVSTEPIYGVNTLANYKFTSYNISPHKFVQIDTTPNPASANATSSYTANTVIREYP